MMITHINKPLFVSRFCVHFRVKFSLSEMANRIKWCLIGIPDHQGVFNVGGRLGAAHGPKAFDEAFFRIRGEPEVFEQLALHAHADGFGGEVRKNHRLAADLVKKAASEKNLTVVVGGGHDHGYSHLLGIREALGPKKKIACINIDAHLDVRKPDPEISSGSPFYLAITEKVLQPKHLVEFGIQSHCNSPALWNFIAQHKVITYSFDSLRNGQAVAKFKQVLKKLTQQVDAIVVSLDLDAIAECHAPGVSAPQAEGFSSSEMVQMMEAAGNEKKVISLGIFELNPLHDIGGRTARLGATCAQHFVTRALRRKG